MLGTPLRWLIPYPLVWGPPGSAPNSVPSTEFIFFISCSQETWKMSLGVRMKKTTWRTSFGKGLLWKRPALEKAPVHSSCKTWQKRRKNNPKAPPFNWFANWFGLKFFLDFPFEICRSKINMRYWYLKPSNQYIDSNQLGMLRGGQDQGTRSFQITLQEGARRCGDPGASFQTLLGLRLASCLRASVAEASTACDTAVRRPERRQILQAHVLANRGDWGWAPILALLQQQFLVQ